LFLTANCELRIDWSVVTEAVANGDKVTLVGFGSFERRERSEREGRNPKTNEPMTIPAIRVPGFSAGKAFKEKVAP
jgi:DNA-binding protein HU-beta